MTPLVHRITSVLTVHKPQWRKTVTTLSLLCIAGAASAAPIYRITDLGTLNPSGSSWAYGLNDAGQVTGMTMKPVWSNEAYVWSSTAGMQALGQLPGSTFPVSYGYGINDTGTVVGFGYVGGSAPHALRWSSATGMQDLGDPADSYHSRAYAINSGGLVAGYSYDSGGKQAVIWSANGSMQVLGQAGPGASDSEARAINSAGDVAGSSQGKAFLWTQSGGMQTFDFDVGYGSWAYGMNDAQTVVGRANIGGGYARAFVWSAGAGMTNIGALPGHSDAIALDINNSGYAVGSSGPDGWSRAFIWSASDGMLDLTSLIDPNDPWAGHTVLKDATAINERGQIVGFADFNGLGHAYLLTPVPEPETQASLLAGLGVIGSVLRRRRQPTR